MKKSHKRLTFAAAIAGAALAASLTACHETVYGPPQSPSSENYDPASEIPEDVYGPPQGFDREDSTVDSTAEDGAEDSTGGESTETGVTNAAADSTESISAPYEKETEYEPESEVPVCVYGPPEAFE